MNLQENIRRILKEETKLPSFIRRRFSEEDINELISDIEFAIPKYGGDKYIGDVIYDEVREFMMNKSEFGKGTLQDNLSNDEWLNQLYKFEEPLRDYVRSVFNINLQEQTKKVLKEESSIKNNLRNMIDDHGFKNAAKVVGGGKRLMKILNLDGEDLDGFIYQYLTDNLHPDYNWGPKLHNFYKEDVKKYGIYEFSIKDKYRYAYLGEWDGYDYLYTLVISEWVNKELTSLFGDKWIPVFKRWFEYNSGLEVREIDLENKYLHL